MHKTVESTTNRGQCLSRPCSPFSISKRGFTYLHRRWVSCVETEDNGTSGSWSIAVVGRRAKWKYTKWGHWPKSGSPPLANCCCVSLFLVLTELGCFLMIPLFCSSRKRAPVLSWLPGLSWLCSVGRGCWNKLHPAVVTEFSRWLEQLVAMQCPKLYFLFSCQGFNFCCGAVDSLGSWEPHFWSSYKQQLLWISWLERFNPVRLVENTIVVVISALVAMWQVRSNGRESALVRVWKRFVEMLS